MPTLFRFLVFILFLGGIVVGSMYALTIFVDPAPREMTERIPARDLFGS